MIDIREIFGEDPYEFQNPIVIVMHDQTLKHAADQFDVFRANAHAELKAMVDAAHERHKVINKTLWSSFESLLKEKNLYPSDFREKTDSIMIVDGVVKHCRRKVDHAD